MKIRAIITGTTGMVGKGVLLECLEHPQVETILVVNRKKLGLTHPKLKEVLHSDFYNLEPIRKELTDYNACFFCLGTTSLGKNEDEFSKITFDLTHHFAQIVSQQNKEMVFNYVSGTGTDTSEKGSVMWARVKGKTENTILSMPFKDAYMFRAGMILPEKGVKSSTGWYNMIYVIFRPLFPLFKKSDNVTTSVRLGLAMINSVLYGFDNKFLENRDINELAKR